MTDRSVHVSAWACTLTLFALGVQRLQAACPDQDSSLKRWSDSSSWPSKQKPSAGSAVVISNGILLDESTADLASVTVQDGGSLVFSPEGDFTLTTDYLLLNGALHIGSEDCPFTANARILLTGQRGAYNITGFGEKFVGVASGSTLELHGKKKLSWAKLETPIPKLTYDNGLLYDKQDDTAMSSSNRGFVAYVINGTTGETRYKKSVTFMGSSYRISFEPQDLVEALNGTEDGDVIVLAVQWNAISDEIDMAPIYDAVEYALYGQVTNTGKVRQIGQYDAWAAVAVKGKFVKEELSQRLNADKRRVASVTAVVPIRDDEEMVVSVISKTNPARYQGGRTHVRLATLDAGARVLELSSDATTWVPGDKVLITSTDYDWEQAEVGEVTYCSPTRCANNEVAVLLVNEYMHFAAITEGVDERAEVALLSRNIVIEGDLDDTCPASNGNCDFLNRDSFGGHIKIEEGFTNVHIEGVTLRHMGQAMEVDRHPIFFRQCGDVGTQYSNYSSPAYVRSIAIVESFNKGIVLSGTHGLTIQDNVIYDHYSHGVFLSEGGETRTVIDGNLVAGARELEDRTALDRKPTSFLITNPLTYLRNNVAAGGDKRGIWFVYPDKPIGESADKDIMAEDEARRTPILQFENNVVHSNHDMGLRIDEKLLDTGHNSHSSNNYRPKVNPLDKDSENTPVYISRLTAFKNRGRHAWIRGGFIIVEESSFADSAGGLSLARSSAEQYLENSVIVGESSNIGEPTNWWDSENEILVPLGRSYPFYWNIRYPIKGFQSFDGPHYLTNVWFQGFEPNDNRTSAAIAFMGNMDWASSAVNEVTGLSFGFDDGPTSGLRMFDGNSTHYTFGDKDGDLQVTLRDKDGSLTGSAGSTVVRNYPVYTTSQCYYRAHWNLAVCPHKYGKLSVSAEEAKGSESRPVLTRDDLDPSLGQEMPFKHYSKFPVILGGSHSYILHWTKFLPKTIYLHGYGFEKDYGLRFGMCVPRDAELELYTYSPLYRPRIEKWKEVSSIQKLDHDNDEGDRYYWDRTNGVIFFKMINPRTRCDDFKEECKDGCPMIKFTLNGGNASDSDCRDRISSYSRDPIDSTGGLTFQPLSATSLPEGMGAGGMVPFPNRQSVDGGYGEWTDWGPCSVTCGGGKQIRTRPCDNPMPQSEGKACVGPREEQRTCGTTPCEVNGAFSMWSDWSSCQSLPENEQKGMQTRARDCSNPSTQHNGIACTGITEQMQACTVMVA